MALRIKPDSKPAVTIHRRAVRPKECVYLLCTPSPQRYPKLRSRIVYIGTTEVGAGRVAASAVAKANEFLSRHGVKRLDAYLLTCPESKSARACISLERDLLIMFRLEHGTVPFANTSGKKAGLNKYSGLFKDSRLRSILAAHARKPQSSR